MKLRSSKAACCLGATLVVMMMPVLPKVTDAKPTYEQHESTITDTEVRVASYAANVEEIILTGYEEQQGQMQNKALRKPRKNCRLHLMPILISHLLRWLKMDHIIWI